MSEQLKQIKNDYKYIIELNNETIRELQNTIKDLHCELEMLRNELKEKIEINSIKSEQLIPKDI